MERGWKKLKSGWGLVSVGCRISVKAAGVLVATINQYLALLPSFFIFPLHVSYLFYLLFNN